MRRRKPELWTVCLPAYFMCEVEAVSASKAVKAAIDGAPERMRHILQLRRREMWAQRKDVEL